MTLEYVLQLVSSGEIDKLKSTVELSKLAYFVNDSLGNNVGNVSTGTQADGLGYHIRDAKQYNPKWHEVHNHVERPNKTVTNDAGNLVKTIKVARLSTPEQKKIVLIASTFLGVPEMSATPSTPVETNMYDVLQIVQDDNKLDYKFKDITKRTMSERECAELWYTQATNPDYWAGTPMEGVAFKLRMRILSPTLGDTLYPIWDEFGDMIAFGRYYETSEQVPGQAIGSITKTCHFDLYTADKFYFLSKTTGQWSYTTNPALIIDGGDGQQVNASYFINPIGKIPIIYYSQPATEWNDVQELIERYEKKISNLADTNDYYDSPIVKLKGKVTGFSDKNDSGKALQMTEGADAEYLTWDSAPASMELEMTTIKNAIGEFTHTPNITFDNIKGLGSFSGIALKMFFMDAHLKASDKEEVFGEGVQRRYNYLKNAIATLQSSLKPAVRLDVTPCFEYFLPRDNAGEVATLVQAYEAGIISLRTAVELNPLVEDADAEMLRIEAEPKVPVPVPPVPPIPPTK